jgi:hypothetical protein
MKPAVLENSPATPGTSLPRSALAPLERPLTIDRLARAVGEHALRQAEIDQKMATRLLELRDELSASKGEIRSLHAQVDQLIQGLSQGLALVHSQSAHTTQSVLQASAAALKNQYDPIACPTAKP